MENKPFFTRVIVKNKIEDASTNDFIKKNNQDNTFILVSAGEKCEQEVKDKIGKEVLITQTNAQKLKKEDGWEYFIIQQESLLMY